MSARFTIDAVGTAALSKAIFDKIGDQVAAEVLADAKRAAPVDTGELVDSLVMERDERGKLFRVGSTDVEHSIYTELGTRKMRAQPYLRPAAYKARQMHQ